MDTNQQQEITLAITKIEDEVKKLIRRVNQLQKSVDLLYQDREILEDMQGSIRALQEVLLHNRKHIDSSIKDVKAEVIEQGLKVEEKVEKVKDTVEQKVEDTKKSVEDNIGGLVQNIEKKKNVLIVKEGLFRKFRRFLTRK